MATSLVHLNTIFPSNFLPVSFISRAMEPLMMRNTTLMSLLSWLCLALFLNHGSALPRKLQQWNQWGWSSQWGNGFNPGQLGGTPSGDPWGNLIPPGCRGVVHPGNPWSYSYDCGPSGSNTPPSAPSGPSNGGQFPPTAPAPPGLIPPGCNGVYIPGPSSSWSYTCGGDNSPGDQSPPTATAPAPPGLIPPECKGVYIPGPPSSWSYTCGGDSSPEGPSTPSSPGSWGPGFDFPGSQYIPPWIRDRLKNPSSPFGSQFKQQQQQQPPSSGAATNQSPIGQKA